MDSTSTIKQTLAFTTRSAAETRRWGEKLGRHIKAGTVVALNGDLGSGKTVFIQGLARGLGVPDSYYVTSPTYTLVNEYPGRHSLFHIDLYRLENEFDFEDIGLYDILRGTGVVAIEWAERLGGDLPEAHVCVQLEISGDSSRDIRITGYGLGPANLLKDIKAS